jgi:hypothetical protein
MVLEPYADRLAERSDWPADARFVRVLLSAVPLDEVDKEHRGDSR